MDDMTRFEDRFEERLRAFARTGVQSVDSAAVARAVAVGHPKSAASRPAGRPLGDEIRSNRQRPYSGHGGPDRCSGRHSRRRQSSPCSSSVPSSSIRPDQPDTSTIPAPAFRASWLQARRPAGYHQSRPHPPSRIQQASGSPPARWARHAVTTATCGSSMAGCWSSVAPTAMRTTPPRSCTTRPRGPGLPPRTCSSRAVASRPRCCATAGCSWGMATTRTRTTKPAGTSVQRCTTRQAAPGPPRGR